MSATTQLKHVHDARSHFCNSPIDSAAKCSFQQSEIEKKVFLLNPRTSPMVRVDAKMRGEGTVWS
jgi:hypothetical protein